jgi:hypothetical protein
MSELMPCPFCGAGAQVHILDGWPKRYFVACRRCFRDGLGENEDSFLSAEYAEDVWNTRICKPGIISYFKNLLIRILD